jgi:hypothetical protein
MHYTVRLLSHRNIVSKEDPTAALLSIEATHVDIVDGNAIFKAGNVVNTILSLESFLWTPLGKTPPFVNMPKVDLKQYEELSPHTFKYKVKVDTPRRRSEEEDLELTIHARMAIVDRNLVYFVDDSGEYKYSLPLSYSYFMPVGEPVPNLRPRATSPEAMVIHGRDGSSGTSGRDGSSGTSGKDGESGKAGKPGKDGTSLANTFVGTRSDNESRKIVEISGERFSTLNSDPLTVEIEGTVYLEEATLIVESENDVVLPAIAICIGSEIVGGWEDALSKPGKSVKVAKIFDHLTFDNSTPLRIRSQFDTFIENATVKIMFRCASWS